MDTISHTVYSMAYGILYDNVKPYDSVSYAYDTLLYAILQIVWTFGAYDNIVYTRTVCRMYTVMIFIRQHKSIRL